ncbi:hypothetical protein MesoLj113b_59590 [Mesorhizobium sp. 113-3-3]|nr:hypothetical protein MesoLj113b_59590 [Mesorhizobium sp. 113-3-3]
MAGATAAEMGATPALAAMAITVATLGLAATLARAVATMVLTMTPAMITDGNM